MTALTLIQGGAEAEMLKPTLVKHPETGQICMKVELGRFNCVLPLPDHLAGATPERLEAFFEAVVPEITENLRAMAAKDRRKLRERAKKS